MGTLLPRRLPRRTLGFGLALGLLGASVGIAGAANFYPHKPLLTSGLSIPWGSITRRSV